MRLNISIRIKKALPQSDNGMKDILDSWKDRKTLHHAYCIVSDSADVAERLKGVLQIIAGRSFLNDPDYSHWKGNSFGIDDAHILKNRHCKVNMDGMQIFIIEALTMTHEAQNALLKLFEEPRGETHFFVIVPNARFLLPTVRSRMQLLYDDTSADGVHEKAEIFLRGDVSVRMNIVAEILSHDDDKNTISFLNGLERVFANHVAEQDFFTPSSCDREYIVEEIGRARQSIEHRMGTTKMALEALALVFPRQEALML